MPYTGKTAAQDIVVTGESSAWTGNLGLMFDTGLALAFDTTTALAFDQHAFAGKTASQAG